MYTNCISGLEFELRKAQDTIKSLRRALTEATGNRHWGWVSGPIPEWGVGFWRYAWMGCGFPVLCWDWGWGSCTVLYRDGVWVYGAMPRWGVGFLRCAGMGCGYPSLCRDWVCVALTGLYSGVRACLFYDTSFLQAKTT